jgi:hypothetical protein
VSEPRGSSRDADAWGTSRWSRLRGDGTGSPARRLVHADLHNHTRLSDGAGDPERAFGSLRRSGLDVAAITDHAVLASGLADLVDLPFVTPVSGIDQRAWRELEQLAAAADDAGAFVALRGFEWSSPVFGHVNVWGTERYTDPLRTLGRDLSRLYDWLTDPAGGGDGLAGFNHPGGRTGLLLFAGFRHHGAAARQLVSLEVFNKRNEHLFSGGPFYRGSPLVRCLDRGWRPALVGVSDEHGDDWGEPDGKGRSGLYVEELSRAGVFDALRRRDAFATREKGLRLDATLGGRPMGTAVPVPDGPAALELRVDLDHGRSWWGRELSVQVLTTGAPLPALAVVADVVVARPDQPVVTVDVPVERLVGTWAVLRVTDRTRPADPRAPGRWAELGEAVAYASPWWLERR